jgi:AraC family transcriptional regulator
MSLEPVRASEAITRPPSVHYQSRSSSEPVARLVDHALTVFQGDRGAAWRYLSIASSFLMDGLDVKPARQPAVEHHCSLARWQTNRVMDYVESKLESNICVDDLAAVVALSKSHFSRAFAKAMGMPPMVYVMARRVERAKVMMTSSERRLSDVALACGFADQSHLTRCFHRVVGLTPSRYRRLHECAPRASKSGLFNSVVSGVLTHE